MPDIEISSDLSELPRLVDFIERFAESQDAAAPLVMQLNLALEEIVTNVIQHGYGERPGKIRVWLERDGDRVHATVTDEAPAYDPFGAAEPDLTSPVEEREVGGLGVHLVREFADEHRYERRGDSNRVDIWMRV